MHSFFFSLTSTQALSNSTLYIGKKGMKGLHAPVRNNPLRIICPNAIIPRSSENMRSGGVHFSFEFHFD